MFGIEARLAIIANKEPAQVPNEPALLLELRSMVGPFSDERRLLYHIRASRGKLHWAVNSYFREVLSTAPVGQEDYRVYPQPAAGPLHATRSRPQALPAAAAAAAAAAGGSTSASSPASAAASAAAAVVPLDSGTAGGTSHQAPSGASPTGSPTCLAVAAPVAAGVAAGAPPSPPLAGSLSGSCVPVGLVADSSGGLDALPAALLEEVCSHLTAGQLCCVASVSHAFQQAASSDALWLRLFRGRWGTTEFPTEPHLAAYWNQQQQQEGQGPPPLPHQPHQPPPQPQLPQQQQQQQQQPQLLQPQPAQHAGQAAAVDGPWGHPWGVPLMSAPPPPLRQGAGPSVQQPLPQAMVQAEKFSEEEDSRSDVGCAPAGERCPTHPTAAHATSMSSTHDAAAAAAAAAPSCREGPAATGRVGLHEGERPGCSESAVGTVPAEGVSGTSGTGGDSQAAVASPGAEEGGLAGPAAATAAAGPSSEAEAAGWYSRYRRQAGYLDAMLCPRCGAGNIIPIVYGFPSTPLLEGMRQRRLRLGGDHLIEACHVWLCTRCNSSFKFFPFEQVRLWQDDALRPAPSRPAAHAHFPAYTYEL